MNTDQLYDLAQWLIAYRDTFDHEHFKDASEDYIIDCIIQAYMKRGDYDIATMWEAFEDERIKIVLDYYYLRHLHVEH